MNGKPQDRKEGKGSEKEGRGEGRGRDKDSRSDYREKAHENREQQSGGGGGEFRPQGGPNREPGADASDYRERAAEQRDQEAGGSDYMQQQEAARQAAEAAKKSGCLPKLFMLIMPFAALGTYLVLRS
jgi:hypothetical protein